MTPKPEECEVCGRVRGEVGAVVECVSCQRRKKPRGRSAPLEAANGYCDEDCSGYRADPAPGDLWPGELRWSFGYGIMGDEAARCHARSGEDSDEAECHRLGYERRGVEITVLRAQVEDAGLALLDCAKERDEARGALREGAAALSRILREAEAFFRHHGHHPDESCCGACEPLRDAVWDAVNLRNAAGLGITIAAAAGSPESATGFPVGAARPSPLNTAGSRSGRAGLNAPDGSRRPSSEYQRGRGDALRQAAMAAAECKRCNCAERKVRAIVAAEKEK